MILPWFKASKHQFHPFIPSMVLSLFHCSTWSDALCQGHRVYFVTLNATIARSLWLIRKSLKSAVFIWGKPLEPCAVNGAYLFHKTSYLQPSHSTMVNMLIWQIRFYWFKLVAILSICRENVYNLSSENNQGQG